jgi:dTDP-4-amino-4,6-dideoxygalactose transaminase
MNSRLDELQAAVLLVKCRRIDQYTKLRREKAHFYTERLKDFVHCQNEDEDFYHVYHQYTIRTPHRDRIMALLREEEISSVIYYPLPLHLQNALNLLGYQKGDFPLAERASREVVSLPMYPEIDGVAQEKVCSVIKRAVK